MRLNCPKCGKPVPDGAAFCGACGAAINPAPPPQPQPPVYAPPPPTYAPPAPIPPAKSGTSCWVIGCIALLVLTVVLGTLGYFGWQKYQARRAEINQTASSELNPPATEQPAAIDTSGSNSSAASTGGSNSVSSSSSASGSGGSASGSSAANIPNPMATLNAFLADAGKGDGQAMAGYMTPQAKADFGQLAEMWGQGDYDHDSWQIVSQQRDSATQWSFEVKEAMRDWETHQLFYGSYAVSMQWDDGAWRVSKFEM